MARTEYKRARIDDNGLWFFEVYRAKGRVAEIGELVWRVSAYVRTRSGPCDLGEWGPGWKTRDGAIKAAKRISQGDRRDIILSHEESLAVRLRALADEIVRIESARQAEMGDVNEALSMSAAQILTTLTRLPTKAQ